MTNTNAITGQPRVSVSSWSLHRTIGDPPIYGADKGHTIPVEAHGKGQLSLLELPSHVATFGIHTMEICHFHLPSLDPGYLTELRGALQTAKVELFSFLVDEGDITHPVNGARDLAWIGSWLSVASALGAERMRVIAGKSNSSEDALDISIRGMQQLVARAETLGLRLMTENWFGVLSSPATVHALMQRLEGKVGLCFDFGNWSGPSKYSDLRAIAQYAESCHAKASFTPADHMNETDYRDCLDITQAAGFSGPYTLIYDGPNPDEWTGLRREREIVQPYIPTP
jgi:sugar phosphate isomerase/epimerase